MNNGHIYWEKQNETKRNLPKLDSMWTAVDQPKPLLLILSIDLCSDLSISFKFDWYFESDSRK